MLALRLFVLPLLVTEVGLAAGEPFPCFALAELLAVAVVVAIVAIVVAIVAVAVVVNDICGMSELNAYCELLCLRCCWAYRCECACCEANHH